MPRPAPLSSRLSNLLKGLRLLKRGLRKIWNYAFAKMPIKRFASHRRDYFKRIITPPKLHRKWTYYFKSKTHRCFKIHFPVKRLWNKALWSHQGLIKNRFSWRQDRMIVFLVNLKGNLSLTLSKDLPTINHNQNQCYQKPKPPNPS